MTRAYIRLDPAFDERKESYPDGPYAALVGTFCLAEQQPERGRFRSIDYLKRLLGRRGKHVAYLLAHGDLTELPEGRIYVDGWDEWQEGDWKVGERVGRIRSRARQRRDSSDVTVPVTPDVTVGVTVARLDSAGVFDSAGGALATAEQGGALTADRAAASARMFVQPEDGLPHITPIVQEAAEAACGVGLFSASDKVQTDLDGLVERQGAEAVIAAFPRVTKGKRVSWPFLVYGTRNLLEQIPTFGGRNAKETDAAEDAAITAGLKARAAAAAAAGGNRGR